MYEEQTTPTGTTTTPVDNDFTLDSLSSIKVSPELRAPIPKTGTIVASLFIPASGAEFDLSSYFDFNKNNNLTGARVTSFMANTQNIEAKKKRD